MNFNLVVCHLKFLNSQIERFEKKTHKELGYALTKSSSNGYKNVCI
jgi:hypothetical protein